ncbi:MAG: hypothetical protein IJZ68_09530 [Bacteroidaceae bacterium]|nr:hypothetical protein [Bacteroidaceae bacterium]
MIIKIHHGWQGATLEEHIKSEMPYEYDVISTNGMRGFTREDAAETVIRAFRSKPNGMDDYLEDPHDEIKYCFLFEYLPAMPGRFSERNVVFTYPTRHGGVDFIWLPSCSLIHPITGLPIEQPQYTDLALIADFLWIENPSEANRLMRIYEDYITKNIYPTDNDLLSFSFSCCPDIPLFFACIKAARVEQDIKRKHGQGPLMMMATMPPSFQRMETTIDWVTGKIVGRHIFGMGKDKYLRPFMSLKTADKLLHKLHDSRRIGYLSDTGHACIIFVPTKRHFIFAYGPAGELILMPYEVLDSTGLHCMLQERTHSQSVMEAWFQHDVVPYAASVNGWRADFDWGYVALLPNGRADVCLYQHWTDKDIDKKINGFKKLTGANPAIVKHSEPDAHYVHSEDLLLYT